MFRHIHHLARPRYAAAVALFAAAVVIAATCDFTPDPTQSVLGTDGRIEISAPFRDSNITIGISARVAGAIDSLTWKGQEFIDSHDHGRELQSAAHFGRWGECFNPTEAGSRRDGTGPTSSSRLISLQTTANQIIARTRMAFWLAPGETSPACPGIAAVNSSVLSDFELLRRVTLGAHGLANVIEHDVTYRVPADYELGVFEAITAYLSPRFPKFWTYDPDRQELAPLSDGPGEQHLPVIMATLDGRYALGVYCLDQARPGWSGPRFGRWRFAATVKWNCVYRARTVTAGDHRFVGYSILGSLSDVATSISGLAASQASEKAIRSE